MRAKTLSVATLGRLLAVLVGFMVLAGCGGSGGGGTTTTSTPTANLSATTLTFSSTNVGITSASQTLTITNTGTATLSFTGFMLGGANSSDFAMPPASNTCGTGIGAGGNCSIGVTFTPSASGTRNGTLTITDNASTSPQIVDLTGTGVTPTVGLSTYTLAFASQFQNVQSPSMPVTLTNNTTGTLGISSITASLPFSVQSNTCGGSVSAGGNCMINVTVNPTQAGMVSGTLSVNDTAVGSPQTVSLSGTGYSNSVPVTVSFGPNGYSAPSSSINNNYYDGIYTTVTVCEPGTTTCATIPNVLVDTGSVGLRVLSSELSNVTLPTITDASGDVLYECVQYGDLSYTWGEVAVGTVQIAGETASQLPGQPANSGVPIQVIAAGGTAPSGAECTSGDGPSDNSVAALGAYGILGVGSYAQDCGSACVSSTSPELYILTPSSGPEYVEVPLVDQVTNPVTAFAPSPTGGSDTNGVLVQLPSVPSTGQSAIPAAGQSATLTFGISTQTCPGSPQGCVNNSLASQSIYELDDYGNFQQAVYNGVTYTSANSGGTFLDTGSDALYVLDPTTLTTATGVTTINCADNGYYCPSTPLSLDITVYGSNSTSGEYTLNIDNADSLFSGCSECAVYNDLGGVSGTSTSTDYFDLGLPFFLDRGTVFVNIAGTNSTYPNGYWAF